MLVLGVNFRYIFLESYHEFPPSYDTVFSEDDTTEPSTRYILHLSACKVDHKCWGGCGHER